MKSLWNDKEAAPFLNDDLALRVYTSRLLGREPNLVLHGGGNTSVKSRIHNLFGEEEELLYVKGSGWDLATIEAPGFAPVRLDTLLKMAEPERLSDSDMVKGQRAAMTDPGAPNPSVEAILHALIPYKYVDHTHADAVVTISNTPDGESRIRELFGERILVVPFVMAGFLLARKIREMCQGIDWRQLDGMVLMNHGVFTFGDDARESYERMIRLVSAAEEYLERNDALVIPQPGVAGEDLHTLAEIRREVSAARGGAVISRWDPDAESLDFSHLADMASLVNRGPLTPDHVIRTKRTPMVIDREPRRAVADYIADYQDYFRRNSDGTLTCLNPAPCWAVWPGYGCLSFGRSKKEADIVADIKAHTLPAIRSAERLGGWQALPEKEIFQMEYWELEQAKLGKTQKEKPLQGKIAIVTGAASGIGLACVQELNAQGAVVVALDIDPAVQGQFTQADIAGVVCDVTDDSQIQDGVAEAVRRFGGLDILISNAGAFYASETIDVMGNDSWDSSLNVNLTSHQRLLKAAAPFLKLGVDPAVVMIASKNVPAPGPGAAAYSVAKAGQTQLARVAALELGKFGVRVNVLHPDAVFDTSIWTPEVLAKRAQHYGITVEEYKTKNILQTEVRSRDVAALACAMAGPLFSRTTGAQLPIDGGNDRVI
jgi:rhamnose utilization protein RhaD (predicted bifunctional aldolase and dehydrogenase)/NAD(P)-dependent dehydrogenase (short-subunit alcohol dehydrogenase family)